MSIKELSSGQPPILLKVFFSFFQTLCPEAPLSTLHGCSLPHCHLQLFVVLLRSFEMAFLYGVTEFGCQQFKPPQLSLQIHPHTFYFCLPAHSCPALLVRFLMRSKLNIISLKGVILCFLSFFLPSSFIFSPNQVLLIMHELFAIWSGNETSDSRFNAVFLKLQVRK